MSDTLQEREDEKTSDWHNFVPQDDYNVRLCAICGFGKNGHYRLYPQCVATVANWCDDCHGYTHMPWCPSYKEPDTRRSGEMGHRTNHEQPASTHQPAARGGGGEWRISTAFGDAEPERAVYEGGRYLFSAPLLSWFELNQIVTEHNQHQALVAERERLRESLADMLSIVEDEGHVGSYIPQVTAARKILAETALTNSAIKQRSTSE